MTPHGSTKARSSSSQPSTPARSASLERRRQVFAVLSRDHSAIRVGSKVDIASTRSTGALLGSASAVLLEGWRPSMLKVSTSWPVWDRRTSTSSGVVLEGEASLRRYLEGQRPGLLQATPHASA
jgi:hypothetical protein